MKLFIDTANVDEIREAASWGILDGVTTNPSLVAKTGRDFRSVIEEICAIVDGPVNAEVVSTNSAGMIEEGERLAHIHPNVYVKAPMTAEGLKATRYLSDRGIRVNVTLVFSAAQALLAAKAGASFISPFVGRLDDIGHDGMALIEQIVVILEQLCLLLRSLGGQRAQPSARDPRCADGCPYRHLPVRGSPAAAQASLDRHRSRALPVRLEKSQRRQVRLTRR